MVKGYLGYSYEIHDDRKGVGSAVLGYVGMAKATPTGLYIESGFDNRSGVTLECDPWGDDDDPRLSVDNEGGIVVIRTPQGDVTMLRLGLDNYRDNIEPFLPSWLKVPEFKTDDDVNEFFTHTSIYDD